MSQNRWLPLESNPNVMNRFLLNLKVPKDWQVNDVYGLDQDLLAIVPQPVAALLFLYPLTDKAVEEQNKEEEVMVSKDTTAPSEVFFLKQFVGNACGTVAIIHAIANNVDKINIEDGPLKSLLEECKPMNYEERGRILETHKGIAEAHEESAQEGQSAVPDRESRVDNHFISIINHNGKIFELDGRKSRPVEHGNTSEETFLGDAALVCKKFMEREPTESRFAILALTAA